MRRTLCLLLGICLYLPPAQAGDFDFAALQSLLRRQDIGSVEELLAALPPQQRERYALVFESRSLQSASPENPRALLYGPDARFIVTFNGSPTQRGFRTLETMEFDAATKEFRLRELGFPERPAGERQITVSEVNPERCARCHGTPARPVWDSFPLWPGAYGERYRATLSARERAGLTAFLAQQATHPRYRQLLDARRFADAETFRVSALRQYAGVAEEPPNAQLATYLSRLQSQALARQLVRQPAFSTYRFVVLGLTDGSCGGLANFYPDALWHTQQGAFEGFARATAAANAQQARLKAARVALTGGTSLAADATASADALVPLRFVAESALALGTQNWSLALEQGTYDFTVPPTPTEPLREALLAEITAQDPARYPTSSGGDRYCSYLQRRSKAALMQSGGSATVAAVGETRTQVPLAGAAASGALAPPAALQLCVTCHETGIAPHVSFSDPMQLTRQLRARPSAHGDLLDEIRFRLSPAAGAKRMPLGLMLSDADRYSLEIYFAALADSAN